MGEAKRARSATAKLLEQHPYCCLCGGIRIATTREHVPPRALFDRSHRPDRLVVPACDDCNRGTSTADLVVSLVARWRFDEITDSEAYDHSRLAARLRKQAPEILSEWTKLGLIDRKKARRHLREHGLDIPLNGPVVSIGAKTIPLLNLFAHKFTLGLYFDHISQPLPSTGGVFATFKTKEDVAAKGMPRELVELFPRTRALLQGVWDTTEQFVYRYDENRSEGLFGCLARLRTGLFVFGLAVKDLNHIPSVCKLYLR
jgi:hypothetical protein